MIKRSRTSSMKMIRRAQMTSVKTSLQKKDVIISIPTVLPAGITTGDEGTEHLVSEAIFAVVVGLVLLGRSCLLVGEAKDTQNNSALLQSPVLRVKQSELLLAIDVTKSAIRVTPVLSLSGMLQNNRPL